MPFQTCMPNFPLWKIYERTLGSKQHWTPLTFILFYSRDKKN